MFLVTLPLFVVVSPTRYQPLICTDEEDDSIRGVAMFTEELHAERARDVNMPYGELMRITSWAELQSFHLPKLKSWGFSHVAIDPYQQSGKPTVFLLIEDLERDRDS